MMIGAVQTTATPAEISAVVVVALVCLGFWLSMLAIASADPGGVRRRRRIGEMQGPVVGGTHVSDCGRSVAPGRRSAVFADYEKDVFFGADDATTGATAAEATPAGATTSTATVPGQRTAAPAEAGQPTAPAMPEQRSGEADRAHRADTGR